MTRVVVDEVRHRLCGANQLPIKSNSCPKRKIRDDDLVRRVLAHVLALARVLAHVRDPYRYLRSDAAVHPPLLHAAVVAAAPDLRPFGVALRRPT